MSPGKLNKLKTQKHCDKVEILSDNQRLCYHKEQYFESMMKQKKKFNDFYEVERITTFMKISKLALVKLNHNFDMSLQRFTQF